MGISVDLILLKSDLIVASFAFLYSASVVILAKILKEKNIISSIAARKLIHTFSALSLFMTSYQTYTWLSTIVGLLMIALTLISKREGKIKIGRELFEAIHEEKEEKLGYLQGPFMFCCAVTLLMFVFIFIPGKWYLPITSLLIMMYSDTLASIVGRRYGKHKIPIPWVNKSRTLEGSIIFLISAFITSVISLYISGVWFVGKNIPLNDYLIWKLSIVMAIVSMFLELISPSNFDDFVIPVGTIIIVLPIFNIL